MHCPVFVLMPMDGKKPEDFYTDEETIFDEIAEGCADHVHCGSMDSKELAEGASMIQDFFGKDLARANGTVIEILPNAEHLFAEHQLQWLMDRLRKMSPKEFIEGGEFQIRMKIKDYRGYYVKDGRNCCIPIEKWMYDMPHVPQDKRKWKVVQMFDYHC